MSAPCEELTASQVAARALAVLDEKETAQLDAHLASCDGCRALAKAVEASFDEASVEKVAAPDDAWGAIEKGLDRLEGKGPQVSLACTYCKDGLDRESAVFCAGCLAPHHEDCFKEHGRCAACREARFVHPSAPVRPRWQRRIGTILALGLGVGVAAFGLVRERDAASATVAKTPKKAPREEPIHEVPKVSIHTPPGTRLGALLEDLNGPSRHRWFTNDPERPIRFDCDDMPREHAVELIAKELGATLVPLTEDATLVDFEVGVDLHYADAPVTEVVSAIARAAKKQVIFVGMDDARIGINLRFSTWVTALHAVATTAGVDVRRRGDILLVRAVSEASRWGTDDLAAAEARCWRVTRGPDSLPVGVTRKTPAHRMTFDTHGMSANSWAYFLGALAGKGVAVPQNRLGFVSLHLEDVSAFDALVAGLATVGRGVSAVDSDSVLVCDTSSGAELDWEDGAPRTPEDVRPHGDALPRTSWLEATIVDRDDPARSLAIVCDGLRKVGDLVAPGAEQRIVEIEPRRVVVEHVATGSRTVLVIDSGGNRVEPEWTPPPLDAPALAAFAARIDAAVAAVVSADGQDPGLELTGAACALVARYRQRLSSVESRKQIDAWEERIPLDPIDARDRLPAAECRFEVQEMARANNERRFVDTLEAFEHLCRIYEGSRRPEARAELRPLLELAKPLAKIAREKLGPAR